MQERKVHLRLRSLLFVPGDRPERVAKAVACGADGIILDLEDAVAPSAKAAARESVARIIAAAPTSIPMGVRLFVRINPLDAGMLAADLAASRGAAALVLPKAEGAASIRRLDGAAPDLAPIFPIVTETAKAMFALGSYGEVRERLAGMSWGAEDLPAALGASTSRDEDGRFLPPYELARSLTLFAGHAAETPVLDTVFPAFKDKDGLAAYAKRAARDGFCGMMAIHPEQVAIINAAFTPSADEVARARAIVAAFAANPGVGALSLDGAMIDAPHLKQAQALLARAGD